MSPTATVTIGLISLLLCTLAAALPAPLFGNSASHRHQLHRRLVIPSQNQLPTQNNSLTSNVSSSSTTSKPASAAGQSSNTITKPTQPKTTDTNLDLTEADTWLALRAEIEALEQAEASKTTNDLSFDDLVTEEDCDPDLATLLDPNTTDSSNLTLPDTYNATLAENVTTGAVSASPSSDVQPVVGNATVQRGTVKADQASQKKVVQQASKKVNENLDDSQKQKQDAEESRKKAEQTAEENRKKAEQTAEENRKKAAQDAEEARKKAEQDAEDGKKKAEQAAAQKSAADEASKKAKADADAASKAAAEDEASKKAAADAEAARKAAADEAKKATDASVAQVKKDEEAKEAAEGKKSGSSYTPSGGPKIGDATFYGTGLGACGVTNTDSDYIVAVSKLLFDEFPAPGGNPNLSEVCGRKINATFKGRSVVVTVQDRCEGCKHDDLDFSPEAFKQIGHPDEGRLPGMQWTWA